MEWEFTEQVKAYNEYSDSKMVVTETSPEYFRLEIGGVEITTGDEWDIHDRVKQINREHGYYL